VASPPAQRLREQARAREDEDERDERDVRAEREELRCAAEDEEMPATIQKISMRIEVACGSSACR
jgi:hypothetical protein